MRLALALVVLLPAVAAAQQPRVLVLRFAGWNGDPAREAVTNALMTEVQLVAEETAMNAATELQLDIGSSEGFATLVSHLEIQLVVEWIPKDDPQVQRRIDQLFAATELVLGQFLDPRPIGELQDELRSAEGQGS